VHSAAPQLPRIPDGWPATCSTPGMSRLLQVLGALSLVAFAATGVAAWLLTKDQIHVTVAAAEPDRGTSDPVAEIADRLVSLEEDIRALARGLGEGLTQLDAAIAEAADIREAARRRRDDQNAGELRRGLTAIENRQAGFESRALAELANLREALAAAEAPLTALEAAPPVAPVPAQEPATTPASSTPVDPAPAPAEATDLPAPEPKKRPSFLAFRLPSDDFSFDGPRTWEVVPELSRVGFDAKSTLHDFTGVTQAVAARLHLDLAHLDRTATGTIDVDPKTLDTGLAGRDEAMRDHLGTDEHEAIRFVLTSMEPGEVDTRAMKVSGTARGRMTIHGVVREVAMPVRMSIDGGRRLHIDGEMPLVMSTYDIEVPSQLGLISVTDEVRVWIALRARPVRKADAEDGGNDGR
jgi:polyisoprenoid-binding protein YceI